MTGRPPPEVHFEATPEWLLVRARGTYDFAWLKTFVRQVAATAEATVPRPKAILADARELTGAPMSDMERFDIGVLTAREMVGVAIALVAAPALVDPRRFGELVARNRGANVRVFTDLDEATAWLREGETTLRSPT